MRRLLLHIEDGKAMSIEDGPHGQQRKIGEMLVIDRIELHFAQQIEQVREFDSKDTGGS